MPKYTQRGQTIYASWLNEINEASSALGDYPPELNASWWPQSISGALSTGPFLNELSHNGGDGRWYRRANWDRSASGSNGYDVSVQAPNWSKGWLWFPSPNGIWINGQARAFFHYWYKKNIWTNGGGYRWICEKRVGSRWESVFYDGEDNREDSIYKVVDIYGPAWFRMGVAMEDTSYASDGSAGCNPFMINCARGHFLRSSGILTNGMETNRGRSLTVDELNSGRVFTTPTL